jgi:hypothetical protein
MIIGHLAAASRLNKRWFFRRYSWQGVSDAVMHLIEHKPSALARVREAATRAAALARAPKRRRALWDNSDDPDAFAAKCFSLIEVGFVAGLLGAARR